MIKAIALTLVAALLLVGGIYVYLVHFEPRPEDTTAARVYAEDAYGIDYCDLPTLDGSGLTTSEIPKAYTPSCETDQWPAPILAGCTEPLPPGADDLRGLWQATEGQLGHIERIEQCGNRVIVSGHRFLHDFRTTGKLADGANDINTRKCTRVRATMTWDDEKVLQFKAFGLIPVVTRRLADENTLVWEYPDNPVSRLKRICRLPARESNQK